jgi:hypothetical protein
MITIVNLFLYSGCPFTSCIIAASIAASHGVGLGCKLLTTFIPSGACDTCVIHTNLKTMGPAVVVVVRDWAYTSTSSAGSSGADRGADRGDVCSSTSDVS